MQVSKRERKGAQKLTSRKIPPQQRKWFNELRCSRDQILFTIFFVVQRNASLDSVTRLSVAAIGSSGRKFGRWGATPVVVVTG